MDNGWGQGWDITQVWEFDPSAYRWLGSIVGYSRDTYERYVVENGERSGVWPVHKASKEAAAFACIDLVERGSLPTIAEQQAAEAEQQRRKAEREAELEREREEFAAERERIRLQMEREKAERAELLETAKLVLPELEARADLSNLETAGLAAIRRLLDA